ncbi:VOC family protein [Trinickia mobilis]|uniref:VOC family protein n=1 Tax=Trinickia mobilis TaxID=2816356 RepID=UPI001A8FF4CC|nr:VOC family protein [Trinickia mobilis]
MTAPTLSLDHLVVVAPTLYEGVQFVADTLGAEPVGGGSHPLARTHNRLLNLSGGAYLEVLAIDPAAEALAIASGEPRRARLFALDDPAMHARLARGPYLAHWVVRVERPTSLAHWQAQYPARIPPVGAMTRGDFSWSLAVPEDGAFPSWQGAGDGIVPTLIQWDTPLHPSSRLPPTGFALKSLTGLHPRAADIQAQLDWLGAAQLIRVETAEEEPALIAEIETPAGLRVLK